MKIGFLHSLIRKEEKLLIEAFKQRGVELVMLDDRKLIFDLESTLEVDVVLENSRGGVTGVEVKASATVELKDFRGLKALAEVAGSDFERGVVFYTGREVLPFHDGDLVTHPASTDMFVGRSR